MYLFAVWLLSLECKLPEDKNPVYLVHRGLVPRIQETLPEYLLSVRSLGKRPLGQKGRGSQADGEGGGGLWDTADILAFTWLVVP